MEHHTSVRPSASTTERGKHYAAPKLGIQVSQPAQASTPLRAPGRGIHSKRTRDMRSPHVAVPSRPAALSPHSPLFKASGKPAASPNPRARKTVRRVLGAVETNLPSANDHSAHKTELQGDVKPQNDGVLRLRQTARPRPRASLRADASLVAQARAHGWDRPLEPEPPVEVIWVDPSPKASAPGSSDRRSRRSSKTPALGPRKSDSGLGQAELPSSHGAGKTRKPRHTIAFGHASKPATPRRNLLPFMPAPTSPSDDPLLLKAVERPLAVLPVSGQSSFSRSTSETNWAPAPGHGILASDGEDSDEDPEMSFTNEALYDMRNRTAQLTSQSTSLILASKPEPLDIPSRQLLMEEDRGTQFPLPKPHDMSLDDGVDDEWSSEPEEPWAGDVPPMDDYDAVTCFAASQESATTQVESEVHDAQRGSTQEVAGTKKVLSALRASEMSVLAPIYGGRADVSHVRDLSPAPCRSRSAAGTPQGAGPTAGVELPVPVKEETETHGDNEWEDEDDDEDDEVILIGSSFSRSMWSAPDERSSSLGELTFEEHAVGDACSILSPVHEKAPEQLLPPLEQQSLPGSCHPLELPPSTIQEEEPDECSVASAVGPTEEDHFAQQADEYDLEDRAFQEHVAHLSLCLDGEVSDGDDVSLATLSAMAKHPLLNTGVLTAAKARAEQSPTPSDEEAALEEAEVSMAAISVVINKTTSPQAGEPHLPLRSEGPMEQQQSVQPDDQDALEEAEVSLAALSLRTDAPSGDANEDEAGLQAEASVSDAQEADADVSMASVASSAAVGDVSDVMDSRMVEQSLASNNLKPGSVVRPAEAHLPRSHVEVALPPAPSPPPAPAPPPVATPDVPSVDATCLTGSRAADQSISFAASLMAARSVILKKPSGPNTSTASDSVSSTSDRANFATWRRRDWNAMETHLIDAIEANPAWIHGPSPTLRSTAVKETRTAPVLNQFLQAYGLGRAQLPQWSRKDHAELSMALSAADRTSAHMPDGIPAWCERALSARAASLRTSLATLAKANVLHPGTMRSDLARYRRRSNITAHGANRSRSPTLHSTPSRNAQPSQRHPLANEITADPACDVTQPSLVDAAAMPPPPVPSSEQPPKAAGGQGDQSTSRSFLQEYRALVDASGVLDRPVLLGPVGPALLDALAASKGDNASGSILTGPPVWPKTAPTEPSMVADESHATQGKVDMACTEFRPRFNRGSSTVAPTIICILGEAGLAEARRAATQLSEQRKARQAPHTLAQRRPVVRRGRPPLASQLASEALAKVGLTAAPRAPLAPAAPTQDTPRASLVPVAPPRASAAKTTHQPKHGPSGRPWHSPRKGRVATSHARIGSPLARSLQARGAAGKVWRSPLAARREAQAARARALAPPSVGDESSFDRSGWKSPLTLRREQALAAAASRTDLSADLSARAMARKSWRSPLAAKRRSLTSHQPSLKPRVSSSASVSDRTKAFADLSAHAPSQ